MKGQWEEIPLDTEENNPKAKQAAVKEPAKKSSNLSKRDSKDQVSGPKDIKSRQKSSESGKSKGGFFSFLSCCMSKKTKENAELEKKTDKNRKPPI